MEGGGESELLVGYCVWVCLCVVRAVQWRGTLECGFCDAVGERLLRGRVAGLFIEGGVADGGRGTVRCRRLIVAKEGMCPSAELLDFFLAISDARRHRMRVVHTPFGLTVTALLTASRRPLIMQTGLDADADTVGPGIYGGNVGATRRAASSSASSSRSTTRCRVPFILATDTHL